MDPAGKREWPSPRGPLSRAAHPGEVGAAPPTERPRGTVAAEWNWLVPAPHSSGISSFGDRLCASLCRVAGEETGSGPPSQNPET